MRTNKKKLTILFVAMAESIHTARWIAQIADQGWDFYLFSSQDCVLPHPELKNTTIYQTYFPRKAKANYKNSKIWANIFEIFNFIANRSLSHISNGLYQKFLKAKIIKDLQEMRLKRFLYLIKKIQPDIIHSMEFQLAGYFVAKAKKRFSGKFPTWIATNWGSDIYYYHHFSEHYSKIKEVLSGCDYYSCECQRDYNLAQKIGLNGKILPIYPNTGGFNLKEARKLRTKKPSERKIILLKGYQGKFGRSLVGLKSLERCKDLLRGFKIYIHSYANNQEVIKASKLFTLRTGIMTKFILPTTHKNILKLHSQARISIGLSISDAISTSTLEAMVMGSFPIQSNTSCADEWIKDGQTGILVPPEDDRMIEKALRKALEDDNLVNKAAKNNWQTAQNRLSETILKRQTINFYKEVITNND